RRFVFPYRRLGEENFDRICQSVSREHGKTLAEARGSAYRGIENIEYACSVPTLLMGDTLENLAHGVDCETMLQPLGVCVGITPFNFPAMVPMWMFPLALACGNTFVLKPSEKVPLTALLIIELLEKAGLPKGVLNVVPGGRECVDALLTHPKVKAVSLVEAARAIKVGPTDTKAQPDMGPVITGQHRDRVMSLVATGEKEGAKIIADGRGVKVADAPNGFYLGATIVDQVHDDMTIARE